MAPATKKRRTEFGKTGTTDTEATNNSVSENLSTDEVEDRAESGEMESSDENAVEIPNADMKKRKQGRKKNVDGTISEKEKAQAVSDIYEYKSNVFRMETEELLKEVRLNYQKRMAPVEKVLHRLKSIIEVIPERLDIPICEAEKEMNKRKIMIPFPDPKPAKDVMYRFSYAKPTYINIVGGYALKTLIKRSEGFSIDLVVSMPSNIFQEKDYLNYRYFHKRAYYLASLAAGIQESKDIKVGLTIQHINEDLLRPILVISPSGNGDELDFTASKCTIRLIPAVSRDTFAVNKLLPSKNCVRITQVADADSKNSLELGPTTLYNSSLLADIAYFKHLSQLHSSSEDCASFKDACILGRVWLHQRGFGGEVSKGGFGHFEWAILMSLLLKGGGSKGNAIVSQGYNNYQMFRAIIQFLATRDLVASPFIFNAGEEVRVKGSKLPVLFDGSNGLNLLFKMTPWSYKLLKHEATITMKLLSDATSENFDAIFLNKVDELHSRFDSIIRIPIPQTTAELGFAVGSKHPDHKSNILSYSYKLYDSLTRGLGDRVSLIHLTLPSPSSRSIELKATPESIGEGQIAVGFMLNATQCTRSVDHGPPAEHKKEAAEYRKFWGPKAELRRFKDGSILESIIWVDKNSKLSIFNQIVQYIVDRHIGAEVAKETIFIGDEFAHILPKIQLSEPQTTASFQPALNGFDLLVKDLRALEGLPLQVRQISAAAPSLRYSTVNIPLASADGQYLMEPADVVVQFESSLKWPEDLVAVQKAKIAFLLKMSELLEQAKGDDIVTRMGLENEDCNIMNSAFLDIVYLTGATFRIRIYHDRERNLLERQLKDKGLSPRKRGEISQALSEHCRSFIYGPVHTQDLQKLCHRFPALSPTIRLVKKWFHSHLLSPHISDEAIELITLRSFINPSSWATPSSVMTGFTRTISFISQWDWRTEPLIVDMSTGDLGASEVREINEKFDLMRKNDPALNKAVLFTASNHCQEGTAWTENGPIKVVATRMTALARSAYELIKNYGSKTMRVETLFIPSMKDYDFIIHLNPAFTVHGIRKKKPQSKFKNLQKLETITIQDISKLGLDPVKAFLSELSNIYGHSLIIFYDCLVGTSVGCLWSPYCTGVRGWKVNLTYSTSPIIETSDKNDDNNAKLVINKKAILNEIARLGGELVLEIEVNRP